MSIFDKFKSNDNQITESEAVGFEQTIDLLQERLAELELALEDKDWMRLNQMEDREFSRQGLKKINKLARMYWLKNPLIKRAVAVQTSYVFAGNVEISAGDDNAQELIDSFWKDEKNKSELTTHQNLLQK
ncbi:MAG: hypothetical protein ACOC4Y_02670, partial [bacterium]